jgi:hypothetical protein
MKTLVTNIILYFICSKSSNPCDLSVEVPGEKSQYFTALTASTASLDCKPPKET